MRCAPKPNAAPSTAAGATSELTGIDRMSVSFMKTSTHSSAMEHQEITEATA